MSRKRTDDEAITSDSIWPKDGLESVFHCPVCEFAKSTILYVDLTDRIFFCAPGSWSMYQCDNCHSAYLNPRPSLDTIHIAYEVYYTHEFSLKRESKKTSYFQSFHQSLTNGYHNFRYCNSRQPASIMAWVMMNLLPHYRAKYNDSMRYLPSAQPGSTLLDIGFGGGKFLVQARNAGWKVVGVDPDPVAVENAKLLNLEVRQGGIEIYAEASNCFDFISLNSVIEHVHNPCETLKLAYKLLKPGGSIYIKTPNIDAYGHNLFKEHWRGLEPPRHLTIFSWHGLESLLLNIGFKQIKKRYLINAYPALAAKSRALSQGKNPYTSKTTTRDHLIGLIARFKSYFNIRNSELIILVAHKPRLKRG